MRKYFGTDGIRRIANTERTPELVYKAAKAGEDDGTDDHAQESGLLAGLGVIDDAGGQDEGAAHNEVCKVTDEGGGGALEHQLYQNLKSFCGDTCHRAKVEGADENGQLTQVQLVKAGGEEQGDFNKHQHTCHAGEHCSVAYVMSAGEGLFVLADEFFKQPCQNNKTGDRCDAYQHKN